MRLYDQLPAALREFNRNCLADWAIGPQLQRYSRLGVAAYIEHMIMADVSTVRRDARVDWGAQANAFVDAQRRRRRRDYLDTPPKGSRL